MKLIGIKSLESNYNPIKRTYNPHFHIIVANRKMGDIIISEWYNRSKKGYVDLQAQDIQRVWDLEKKLMETIKYGSKVFTELKENNANGKIIPKVYIKALDIIYKVMKGRRIFDRFGFNLPKGEAEKLIETNISKDAKSWEFNLKSADWSSSMTEEVLTDYKVPAKLSYLLKNNLNTNLS